MRSEVQNKVSELSGKWTGFLGKVDARVKDVLAEANEGLDMLIAQHATDHGPMGAAFSALQARFHGLGQKVSDSWDKIDEEIDEITELDDLSEQEYELIYGARDQMRDAYDRMVDALELHHSEVEMQKNADWARRLRAIAEEELKVELSCARCGAPYLTQDAAGASQQKCPSCGAVNEVMPGMAAGLFYRGIGAHALAQEQAWQKWLGERSAKAAFDARRHPTAYDLWVYHQAARDYWTAYYTAGKQIYPKFTEDVALAVEAKMKHYSAWDQDVEVQKRELFGRLVDASGKGDAAAVNQLIGSLPHHVDLDECIEALVERRHFPAAKHLLGIKYDQEGEDEPKGQWIAQELAETRKLVSD